MGQFFNLDNKFFQVINKIVDCFGLSILWLVCSIPAIVTFYLAYTTSSLIFWLLFCVAVAPSGVALTAVYYAVNKVIIHNRSYVWTEFRHAFASNFKQASAVSVILAVAAVVLGIDAYIMYQYAKEGKAIGSIYIVFVILIVFEAAWAVYIFPYMARFENTVKQLLKNTAYIAIANLPRTIIMAVVLGAVCLSVYLFPVILIIIPSVFLLFVNLIIEKVFRKYMSEEDALAEDERNRDSYH